MPPTTGGSPAATTSTFLRHPILGWHRKDCEDPGVGWGQLCTVLLGKRKYPESFLEYPTLPHSHSFLGL